MQKYFGMKAIAAVADTGDKTKTGSPVLKVLYEDGTSLLTTEKFLNLVQSEVPLDATAFRNLLFPAVIKDIFVVFTEYNLRHEDMTSLLTKLAKTWDDTLNHAVNYKMGVTDMDQLDMLVINKLNDQAEAEKNAVPSDAGTASGTTGV
jgi:hypothetical protein